MISANFDQWLPGHTDAFLLTEPADPAQRGARKPYDQVHLGVGAASFGNVLVGLYGLWHNQRGTKPKRPAGPGSATPAPPAIWASSSATTGFISASRSKATLTSRALTRPPRRSRAKNTRRSCASRATASSTSGRDPHLSRPLAERGIRHGLFGRSRAGDDSPRPLGGPRALPEDSNTIEPRARSGPRRCNCPLAGPRPAQCRPCRTA